VEGGNIDPEAGEGAGLGASGEAGKNGSLKEKRARMFFIPARDSQNSFKLKRLG